MKLGILFLIFINTATAATWQRVVTTSAASGTGGTVLASAQCPTNYILVPKNTLFVQSDFCVMKYEAKNDGYTNAISVAAGVPWVGLSRDVARSKCQLLGHGYDLMSNDQWQTIGRNITTVTTNWTSGVINSGEVNRGHTDNAPAAALAASTDDNDPCISTGQTCSSTVWNQQRRTNVLSNGNILWDFGGNIDEWVTLNSVIPYNEDQGFFISGMPAYLQLNFGAASNCSSPGVSPFCGFGFGGFAGAGGAVVRGSSYSTGLTYSGIFSFSSVAISEATHGFRCVYKP